MKAGPWAVLMI